MTRLILITALLLSVFTWCTPARADDAKPADDQAAAEKQLPEGHPQLPAGHPQLPAGHPQLPAGHPPMQTKPGTQGLPAGHPPINAQPAKVYETTDAEPDWYIQVRHLIVRPMAGQYYVTEVWAVVNPTEKAYIGKVIEPAEPAVAADETVKADDSASSEATPIAETKADDAAVKEADDSTPKDEAIPAQPPTPTTLVIAVPAAATHIQPGEGFDANAVQIKGNTIYRKRALNPGTNELSFSYLVAPKDGVAELPMDIPAATNHMMVLLPDDGSQVEATGLAAGDGFKAGDKSFMMFSANNVEKGTETKITIKAQAEQAPDQSAMAPTGAATPPANHDSNGTFKVVAGVGAGVLLLVALVLMLKPSKKQACACSAS